MLGKCTGRMFEWKMRGDTQCSNLDDSLIDGAKALAAKFRWAAYISRGGSHVGVAECNICLSATLAYYTLYKE